LASKKAIIGLIFKSIPTVEELIPESAYKFKKSGIIVNKMAIVSMHK
jgi:ArsR family metal-binding transcriptional regulator